MQKNSTVQTDFCLHCQAWKGQHGLEPDFRLYLQHCKLWMQECIRVLRDDGIIFINIGDSYASNGGASRHRGYSDPKYQNGRSGEFDEPTSFPQENVKPKSKLLIPERFAIMCVDELGLILRNHIVWHKINPMPESCQDRFARKWESVFMFVKKSKYYFNLDAVREPQKSVSIERLKRGVSNNHKFSFGAEGQPVQGLAKLRLNMKYCNISKQEGEKQKEGSKEYKVNRPYTERKSRVDGKNPGDVWQITNKGSSEKHFATYPEKIVEKMILCSTQPGDIVLDPFCGSATTLRVAERLNRKWIGIDLGYEDIQKRLLSKVQKELI